MNGSLVNHVKMVEDSHPNTTNGEGGIFSGHSVLGTMLAKFLVQAIIVIVLSRIFDIVLRYLRQPRVVAEVLSGICLGPSVLGRIPGFTATIFPPSSIDPLKLVANVGLVMYMFLVGLELDPRSFFANIRETALISVAGMIIPFGLGVALSYGLYNYVLLDPHVPFSSFLLFTGVALSITAFPVLARILSERRLFGTTVGSMTISSAAFDDATAWCLLALVLSIINASDPLTVLWVFLTMFLYVIILLVVVRTLLAIFVRLTLRSRRFAAATIGQPFLAFTFVFIFVSAWITEFIGVHAIFGAFLVGVIMPRGTGIVVSLTEKIEDLVSVVLLPLYFASSGLKTQIGLLDDGPTWGWLLAVIAVACIGKIGGCLIAAKLSGLNWRESFSIGILMNTKGLVELIVLNIGLDAHVINGRIFAIMVVMCLVTTFMTSPLIALVYPVSHQVTVAEAMRLKALKALEKDQDGQAEQQWLHDSFNVLACVDRMEQVPSVVSLASKFQLNPQANQEAGETRPTPLVFNVLRLMETSDRSSTMFYASSASTISPAQNDHVLQVMTLFNRLLKIQAKCFYAVAPVDAYGEEVDRIAASEQCGILLMTIDPDGGDHMAESILKANSMGLTPVLYVDRKRAFETQVVAYSPIDPTHGTAVVGAVATAAVADAASSMLKIMVPFSGGRLDRKALKLALRLSQHPTVHVTVLHISLVNKSETVDETNGPEHAPKIPNAIAFISNKIQETASSKTIDLDGDLINEAKRQSANRPQALVVRVVTTTNITDCVVAECKQNSIDLVVVSHKAASTVLSSPVTPVDRRQMRRGSYGENLRTENSLAVRKISENPFGSSLQGSLRKRTVGSWMWPSGKENILGNLGYRLLTGTEASLLVVGRENPDETIVRC